MLRLAVLGSGRGSNFQSILEAVREGRLEAELACVVSDHADAFILERARTAGVPAVYADAAPFRTKLDGAAEQRVIQVLRDHGADCVALAGFMRIIKAGFLEAFPNRVVNIHPSLLPAFPGLEAWKQALDYGSRVTGCTVHFVDAGTDTGPIILQRACEVRDDDTAGSLHARIQEQEHPAYPEALDLIARGRLQIRGRRVVRLPADAAGS